MRFLPRFTATAVFALGVLASAIAPTATAQPITDEFVIRRVRVFDGRNLIPQTDVWVRSGKIHAVAQDLSVPTAVPSVDGTGRTLLPGLVDSHAHSYTRDGLKNELLFGVTTELGMQNDPAFVAEMKQQQAAGKALDLADLRSACWPATVPNGHGAEGGAAVPTLTRPDEAQSFVDARLKEGSDFLKIIYEDGSEWSLRTPTLTKQTVSALVFAAHSRGLLAVAHIGNAKGAAEMINVGVDGLAHLFIEQPPDPGFGRLVKGHHAFVIATMATLESASGGTGGASLAQDPRLEPYLTSQAMTNLRLRNSLKAAQPVKLEYAFQAEKQLLAAGVPILAGTDAPGAGTWFGVSMHRELELLVKGGMSPIQALQSATSTPATTFHLTDRGCIVKGLRADLLLVNGDPTKDITSTRAIVAVWKQGVAVDREVFRAEIAKERAEIEKLRQASPPVGSEAGLISDFENGRVTATFGAGWSTTTGFQGGASKASMNVVDGGANGSRHSLEVAGEIVPDVRYPLAGVVFSPGPRREAPANLAAKKSLSFWVKGDGRTYQLMVFARGGGGNPATQTFMATAGWQRVTFPFSRLSNPDGYDITAIQFVAGPEAGQFRFQLDDIKLEP